MCRMVIDNNDIPKQDYMVLCSTITYNQAPYITDTMNGFCMQQTSFSYACYIIDDASTDGEQDVIKAYLDEHFQMDKAEQYELELANVIVAKHNTNPNCTFAVYLLKRNLWKEPDLKRPLGRPWTQRCKYIALCEGDDYWTDPHKLQKQVDFLDTHPEYVLCCHRYKILNQNDGTWNQDYIASFFTEGTNAEGFAFTKKDNLHTWITKTMTLMYRRDVVMPDTKQFKYWRDAHFNYYMLKQRKGFCLPDVAAVYRRHSGGIFSPLSDINKNRINYLVIHELFSMNKDDKDLQEFLFALHPSFFAGIRNRIQQGDKKCLWNDICIYLRVEFSKSGVYGVLYSIKKMLRSYTYRLF